MNRSSVSPHCRRLRRWLQQRDEERHLPVALPLVMPGLDSPRDDAQPVIGRRWELPLLAALAIAFPLGWWIGSTVTGHGFSYNDFHDYWLAAKLITLGKSPYDMAALTDLAKSEGVSFVVGTGYSYPLPFAVAMIPLTTLPFTVAVSLFNAISLVVFGLTVGWWILWAHGRAPGGRGRRALLAFAAGAYPPVWGTIANGQANLLLFGMLALGTALVLAPGNRARAVIGGVAIGLTAVVKLIPGLLAVPLLLGRRGLAVLSLALSAAASLVAASWLAPFATAGSDRLTSLFETDPYFTNQSINGFVSRLVRSNDRTAALWPGAFDPAPVMLALTALFALATAMVLWRYRARLNDRPGLALAMGVALTAGLIGAPKGTYWTQALALVPVGLLLATDVPDLRRQRLPRQDQVLLAAWLVGTIVQTILWLAPPPPTAPFAWLVTLATSSSLIGLLALWWLLVRRLQGVQANPAHALMTVPIEPTEECGDVPRHQVRLLDRGEVPPARHRGPAPDVVQALGPLPWRLAFGHVHMRECGHRGRHADEVIGAKPRFALPSAIVGVVADGEADGSGQPVERDGGQEEVAREARLEIAATVAPGAPLLQDPGRQPRR
jgi:hypothetical protein